MFQEILQLIKWKKQKQNKTGLNGYVYNFSVDYNIINSNIIDIHKYSV